MTLRKAGGGRTEGQQAKKRKKEKKVTGDELDWNGKATNNISANRFACNGKLDTISQSGRYERLYI